MANSGEQTSLTLLQRVKNEDAAAWKRFVSIYSPLVLHWCTSSGRLSRHDAADVLQDVFLSVSKSIRDFRRDRAGDSLRGWLRVITQNKIRNYVNRRAKQIHGTGGSVAKNELQQVPSIVVEDEGTAEESIVMRRAVKLLESAFEESTYRAFWRFAIEGVDSSEVADELGMTPQAVRQACYRVRRKLQTELGDVLS